jgi:hypothetical protein
LKSTLSRLDKFFALPSAGQFFLIRVFILVAAVRLGLWVLPFRIVRKLVDAAARRPTAFRKTVPAHRENHNCAQRGTGGSPVSSRSIASSSIDIATAAIQIVSRYIPSATCLTQALAAQTLLARAGNIPILRIGVLRSNGQFKAHAWVECAGRIVIGEVAGIEEFKALTRL